MPPPATMIRLARRCVGSASALSAASADGGHRDGATVRPATVDTPKSFNASRRVIVEEVMVEFEAIINFFEQQSPSGLNAAAARRRDCYVAAKRILWKTRQPVGFLHLDFLPRGLD